MVVGLLTALAQQPATAQSLPIRQLIEQGQYWASRGDDQRAAEAWGRALRSDPDQPEALYGLAMIGLGNKRMAEGQKFLGQLKRMHPDSPLVARLEQEIALRGGDAPRQIDKARELAQAGDSDGAVAQYRSALAGKAPQGPMALEYYQTLGYTEKGWDEARSGLEQLARQSPDDYQVKLALGQLLINREATRAAGIRQLQRLSTRPDVGGVATESLRQALSWLGTPPRGADRRGGAQAASPSKSSPAANAAQIATDTANYWALVQQGAAASKAGNTTEASRLLTQAVKLDTRETTADTLLGTVQAQQGLWAAAESTFRSVLARRVNDADATRGLINVLSQNGKTDEALRLAERLPPDQQNQLGSLGQMRARKALEVAKAAGERGDDDAARTALQDALLFDPSDPWLRLTLARLYLKNGAAEEARGLVDGLLVSHPDMPDALYASALIDADTREWRRASASLERIPPASRNAAITALQRRVTVYLLTGNASALGQQRRMQDAYAQLAQAESAAGNDNELMGAVASSYADLGDAQRAVSVMRQLMARSVNRDVNLQLNYAGLLLRTRQDVELAGILRQLQTQKMTSGQMQSFQDIRNVYTIRQADILRGRGDLVGAYDVIKPVLAARPDDAAALAALARMYADSGNAAKAQELYARLLRDAPDSIEALLGSASAAAVAKDTALADTMLDRAVKVAPADQDVLATAARIYKSQGRTAKAEQMLKAAIALQTPPMAQGQGQPAVAEIATPAAMIDDNPFVRPGTVRAQGAGAPASPAAAGNDGWSAHAMSSVAALPLPAVRLSTDPAVAGRLPARTVADNVGAALSGPLMADAPPSPSGPLLGTVPQERIVAPIAPLPIDARAGSRSLQDELADIRQIRSPGANVGAGVRTRKGEDGMSRLSDVKAPVEITFPVGDGKAAIRVTPVSVSAGSLGTDSASSSRFGGGPAAAAAQAAGTVGTAGSQRQTGTGLAVGYAQGMVDADIGTTPLGFEHSKLIGGVKLQGALSDRVSNQLDVSRRAVTDSVLSFAGTRDDRTGQSWGGVTATGARYLIGAESGGTGVYGNVGYASLNGTNVVSNSRLEGGVGVYTHVINAPGQRLTTGLNLTALAFDKNLRYFTYGHGGYFSPQQFVSLSVPLTWAQTQDRLSYQLGGSLGIQHFREDGADYFPGDASAQSAAAAAANTANSGNATYAGQSKTGLGYNLAAALEYRLTPHLVAGGNLGLDNASDYRQFVGKVYLRYRLQPMTGSLPLPVAPFRSPYGD